jgi:hypothetical protein
MLHRLSREAAIFALIGLMLTVVGAFVYLHHSQAIFTSMAVASFVGLYGLAGGFCVWLFYRLVRFAIEG